MFPPDADFLEPDEDDDEDDDGECHVDLDALLEERRGDSYALERYGFGELAAAIREFCDEIEVGLPELFEYLSEEEAAVRSELPASWFSARFAAWAGLGYAREGSDGARRYCRVVIPPRVSDPA